MSWYSQYGEDILLAAMFKLPEGVCVEVGANDGLKFSNTKYFEDIGWQCILVEPNPHLSTEIRKNRRGLLFECAASDAEGRMTLHIAEGYDLYSSLESQSNMAEELSRCTAPVKSISVKVRPLDDILLEAGIQSIDFVSIDVEGHEVAVLGGFDLDRWRPSIVIIEDKSDLIVTEVERYMARRGYQRFYRSGGNDWYAKAGRVSPYFMFQMVITAQARLSGLLKVWLPRPLTRLVLLARRFLLSRRIIHEN